MSSTDKHTARPISILTANTLGPDGREKVKDAVVVDSYDKVVDALLR